VSRVIKGLKAYKAQWAYKVIEDLLGLKAYRVNKAYKVYKDS
jgi:hypothetical protein